MRELRIAISGAPGTGKTQLARALAGDLGVPYLAEEMRAHLERSGRPLAGLPSDEVERILVALWRERAASERELAGFVADNSSLDFAAYAVYYDCLAEPAPDEPRRTSPSCSPGRARTWRATTRSSCCRAAPCPTCVTACAPTAARRSCAIT